MADNGTFRTSFKGFHKEDVLSYIDTLQARQSEELAQLQQQLDASRQQAAEADDGRKEAERLREQAEETLLKLQAEITRVSAREEELARTLAELRQNVAETEDLRRENRRLNEKIQMSDETHHAAWEKRSAELEDAWRSRLEQAQAERDAAREELSKQRERIQEESGSREQVQVLLEQERARAAEWEASSRRYEQLIGDVGGFIMEIRAMGQRFLETSYKRSEGCLDALDDAVDALERQLADNRADVEQARQELMDSSTAAGLHMEDLLQALEDAGERASVPVENPAGAAADTAFFR